MSKSETLTAEEFDQYQIKGAYLPLLKQYARDHGLTPPQIYVLDWGCGRGRFVLRLRELGYNAFGVDLDPLPIKNGKDIFIQKGLHASGIPGMDFPLRLLQQNPQGGWDSGFADGFFHCVFSGQVLEHVSNLPAVVVEMARLTCPGGIGYHNFPAQKHVREAHLYMPFVHWLPKNDLRRRLIQFYLRLGFQPGWEEVRSKSINEQAAIYAAYSIQKTYYRPAAEIRKEFEAGGFQANFNTLSNPGLKRIRPFLKTAILRRALNDFLTTFVLAELYLQKPGRPLNLH